MNEVTDEARTAIVQQLFTTAMHLQNADTHVRLLAKELCRLEESLHQLGIVDAETHGSFNIGFGKFR